MGNCFDLLDVRFTGYLKMLFPVFKESFGNPNVELPKNEKFFHRLDCAFLNWAIPVIEHEMGTKFDTIRGVFLEGEPSYPGAHFFDLSHIQIAVRRPSAIVGYFHPSRLDQAEDLGEK